MVAGSIGDVTVAVLQDFFLPRLFLWEEVVGHSRMQMPAQHISVSIQSWVPLCVVFPHVQGSPSHGFLAL